MSEPTPRQIEVLVAWIECGTSDAAGRRLGMHPVTVRRTLADLRTVYGVANPAQVFACAVRDGLIDPAKVTLPDAA